MDAPIWDVTVFTKNRERRLAGDVAARFMAAVLGQQRVKALLSDEHFSVDGTLIEALRGLLAASLSGVGSMASWPSMGQHEELSAEARWW